MHATTDMAMDGVVPVNKSKYGKLRKLSTHSM